MNETNTQTHNTHNMSLLFTPITVPDAWKQCPEIWQYTILDIVQGMLYAVFEEWDDYENYISLKLTRRDGSFHQVGYYDEFDGERFVRETTYRCSDKPWSEENRHDCKVILPAKAVNISNLAQLKGFYGPIFEHRNDPFYYYLFHVTWEKLKALDWSDIVRVDIVDFNTLEIPVRYIDDSLHVDIV